MNKSLKVQTATVTQEEIDNPNSPISSKEIDSMIKIFT